MENLIKDKQFLESVKAWANFTYEDPVTRLFFHGKPENVNAAIQTIQNILGSIDIHTALGFNECYYVENDNDVPDMTQIFQWFRMKPETLFQDTIPKENNDGLYLEELETNVAKFLPNDITDTQKHTERIKGVLVLHSQSHDEDDQHGHWVYAQKPHFIPSWFVETSAYKSALTHESHPWKSIQIRDHHHPILFGKSYDYIQPWGSNTFCQATAIGFALAFTSDDKDLQTLIGSYISVNQNYYDNLIKKQKWFKQLKNKRLLVPAWKIDDDTVTSTEKLEEETVEINILGSEFATKDDFVHNWKISFKIVKHLVSLLQSKIDSYTINTLKKKIRIIDTFLAYNEDGYAILAFDR